MKWHNSQKSELPSNGQEVFIMVDGINYNAIFNETEKTFIVKNLKDISFNLESKLIYWAEILPQENTNK